MQTVCERIFMSEGYENLMEQLSQEHIKINARNSKWSTVANLPKLKFKTKKEREKKAGL